MTAAPLISVIIPSYNMRGTIRSCLRSALEQDLQSCYEVIVVDSSDDGSDQIISREFPGVILLRQEERMPAGEARNLGVAKASGTFAAFTDADCIVAKDWLRRLVHRHQGGDFAAVGGSIANGTPWSLVGSAEHLFAFNEFLPQAPERLATNIPTCNLCYRKSVLTETLFEGGPEGVNLAEDTVLNWDLVRRGAKLLFDPAIRVVHMNRTHLGKSLHHQHLLGQAACWARKRTADLPGRLFADYPLLVPLMPFLRMARIGVRLSKIDRGQTLRFLALSPLILLEAAVWTAGFMREALRGMEQES